MHHIISPRTVECTKVVLSLLSHDPTIVVSQNLIQILNQGQYVCKGASLMVPAFTAILHAATHMAPMLIFRMQSLRRIQLCYTALPSLYQLHFHGIRQNWTSPQDGAPSITQCPTAPVETVTYRWTATRYGSTWYVEHTPGQ